MSPGVDGLDGLPAGVGHVSYGFFGPALGLPGFEMAEIALRNIERGPSTR